MYRQSMYLSKLFKQETFEYLGKATRTKYLSKARQHLVSSSVSYESYVFYVAVLSRQVIDVEPEVELCEMTLKDLVFGIAI